MIRPTATHASSAAHFASFVAVTRQDKPNRLGTDSKSHYHPRFLLNQTIGIDQGCRKPVPVPRSPLMNIMRKFETPASPRAMAHSHLIRLLLVCVIGLLSTAAASGQVSKPAYWEDSIDFTANHEITPNLDGPLKGEVAFLQNTLVGPKQGDVKRPRLVTDRAAYLLFFPVDQPSSFVASEKQFQVVLRQQNLPDLRLTLLPPWKEPRNDSSNSDGRPPVVYSKRAWTAVLPWEYMHYGLELAILSINGDSGKLIQSDFEFGPPLELVTQHIELGMLLPPEKVQINKWSNPKGNISPQLALDYFQMVPVSRFTAAQYLPIHFPKVVLPNGNVYTERSTFEGAGIYAGDMRQNIAKGMVSTGINLANIGVPSSVGGTEKQPRPYRQTTVHTSAGVYTETDEDGNQRAVTVRHGLSGGGGQLTLSSTTGNEFSHEYGHDHGLPHYPGGKELSAHSRSGSWGYNLFKNRLIGNVAWNGTRPEGEFPYGFGHDAMAGGSPMGNISVFTLHTPFSLNMIQETVGKQSGVLDGSSPSGYKKWDAEKQQMVVSEVKSPKPDQVGVPVVTLVGVYDPIPDSDLTSFIFPALYGNWGNVFSPQTIKTSDPDLIQTRCHLEVTDANGKTYRFPLNDERYDAKVMNQFHINLPASVAYQSAAIIYQAGERKILDIREIAPPHGKLPEPVIVGREQGFTKAALRLGDMDTFLTANGYPSEELLRQAMEDFYGPIKDYEPGVEFKIGGVYRRKDGSFYQAGPPEAGQDKLRFRKLGDSKKYLSKERLMLGVASKDYANQVLKGKSGVFYYVPVDHQQVLKSDAPSRKSGKWYAGGDHSKITVNAISNRGVPTPIVLRGQINGRHVINRGAPVGEASRVQFTYLAEDNPDLTPGKYKIGFPAYAQAWHTGQLVESFQVFGLITVKK